mmetsp:Transcript_29888/g.45698  ORF Transcript_29888/g.45698 Transcript_29888/m.45698 type:complete len:202 (-) Transcript_29888:212-817(-)
MIGGSFRVVVVVDRLDIFEFFKAARLFGQGRVQDAMRYCLGLVALQLQLLGHLYLVSQAGVDSCRVMNLLLAIATQGLLSSERSLICEPPCVLVWIAAREEVSGRLLLLLRWNSSREGPMHVYDCGVLDIDVIYVVPGTSERVVRLRIYVVELPQEARHVLGWHLRGRWLVAVSHPRLHRCWYVSRGRVKVGRLGGALLDA